VGGVQVGKPCLKELRNGEKVKKTSQTSPFKKAPSHKKHEIQRGSLGESMKRGHGSPGISSKKK